MMMMMMMRTLKCRQQVPGSVVTGSVRYVAFEGRTGNFPSSPSLASALPLMCGTGANVFWSYREGRQQNGSYTCSSIHYFWTATRLETTSRSTTTNLASYDWTGLAAAQHRLGVSLATGSGSWTVKADSENGYAPGWEMLLMMMTDVLGEPHSGRFLKQEQWERWWAKRKLVSGSKHCGDKLAHVFHAYNL